MEYNNETGMDNPCFFELLTCNKRNQQVSTFEDSCGFREFRPEN